MVNDKPLAYTCRVLSATGFVKYLDYKEDGVGNNPLTVDFQIYPDPLAH